jgi:hypothetical protein
MPRRREPDGGDCGTESGVSGSAVSVPRGRSPTRSGEARHPFQPPSRPGTRREVYGRPNEATFDASPQMASASPDRSAQALPRPPRFRRTGREGQHPPDCGIPPAPRASERPGPQLSAAWRASNVLRLMTGTMWPGDSGRTAPESIILQRDGKSEAVSRGRVSGNSRYSLCPGFRVLFTMSRFSCVVSRTPSRSLPVELPARP